MVHRLSALRLRTRLALSLVLVSVPVAVVAGSLAHRATDEHRICTMMAGFSGVSVGLEVPGLASAHDRFAHRALVRERRAASQHRTIPVRRRLQAIRRAVDRDLGAHFGIRRVIVCVAGRCERHPLGDFSRFGLWPPVRATGPDRLRVSVAVDRPGAPWQVAHTDVRLRRAEPNGPGCGTWWNAAVRMRDGRLETLRG